MRHGSRTATADYSWAHANALRTPAERAEHARAMKRQRADACRAQGKCIRCRQPKAPERLALSLCARCANRDGYPVRVTVPEPVVAAPEPQIERVIVVDGIEWDVRFDGSWRQ